MRPIKLTVEGVFSYRAKQEVDFEKLSLGGIFGIFGNTGSGKSSLIEAVIFTLYGRSDRIAGRQADLINLASDKARIEFEFESFAKRYLFVVNIRRTKASHETKRGRYVMEEGNYRALGEDVTTEEVIGLSYDNFCKIVIIPQGKFQDFFALTEKERTSMLKEIFPILTRYDLKKALDAMTKEANEKLSLISGRIGQLEEYTKESLAEAKTNFEKTKQDYELLVAQNAVEKETLEKDKHLFQLFENLDKTLKEQASLEQKTQEVCQIERRLKEYELAVAGFGVMISSYDNCALRIRDLETKKEQNSKSLLVAKERFEALNTECGLLQKENEKTPLQQKEAQQINALMELQTIENEREKGKTDLQNALSAKQKGETLLQEVEKQASDLEKEIQSKEARLLNLAEFASVRNWFWQKDALEKNLHQRETELADLESQRSGLQHKMQVPAERDPIEELQKLQVGVQNRIKDLENSRSQCQIEQALSGYSASLTENEPCPLCGSLSHPKPARKENVDKQLTAIESQIQEEKRRESSLLSAQSVFENLRGLTKSKQSDVRLLKAEMQELENKFVWGYYRGKSLSDITAMEKEDTALRSRIDEKRKAKAETDKTVQRYKQRLDELGGQISTLATRLAKYDGRIEQLALSVDCELKAKYSTLTREELGGKLEEINRQIEQRTRLLQEKLTLCAKQNEEFIRLKANEVHFDEDLTKHKGELSDCERSLQDCLQQSGFSSIEQVKQILAWKPDVETLRQQITDFRVQSERLKMWCEELSNQTLGKTRPNEEEVAKNEQKVAQNELQIRALLETKGKTEALAAMIEEKLREKQALQAENKQRMLRLQLLAELSAMFKGDKFVQFVSTVYLRQLCSKANERLRIITQNKFELRYVDRNFEIADFLNGGKTRSIKTLSGGQMFQASLCMALALVDTIRLNANTNQDFFFIDEGFGTQDAQSIDLIFQSLKALQRENKTVGLISHNDLLKEKINCSIDVLFDEKEGSRIETAYR